MFGFQVPCGENRETSENLVRAHRCKMSVIAGCHCASGKAAIASNISQKTCLKL